MFVPTRSPCASPRATDEHRDGGARDVGALRRRCLEDTSADGAGQLLRDAFLRMRVSDGFSHARSLAFMTSLVLVQGTIVLVGVATALGDTNVSHGIVSAIHTAAPGPAGRVLTTAVRQAHGAGNAEHYVPLALGSIGALVAATTRWVSSSGG